jgi:hypothetical protein
MLGNISEIWRAAPIDATVPPAPGRLSRRRSAPNDLKISRSAAWANLDGALPLRECANGRSGEAAPQRARAVRRAAKGRDRQAVGMAGCAIRRSPHVDFEPAGVIHGPCGPGSAQPAFCHGFLRNVTCAKASWESLLNSSLTTGAIGVRFYPHLGRLWCEGIYRSRGEWTVPSNRIGA